MKSEGRNPETATDSHCNITDRVSMVTYKQRRFLLIDPEDIRQPNRS
jgi:hypothetical protein